MAPAAIPAAAAAAGAATPVSRKPAGSFAPAAASPAPPAASPAPPAAASGDARPGGRPLLQTAHQNAPVTAQRPVPADLSAVIPEPATPRAFDCPSVDHPTGATDNPKAYGTPLQQHVAFFDRNQDGIITPFETYEGFGRIGFNAVFSFLGTLAFHLLFSYHSQDSWFPDPLFRIRAKNIHKCKHGSDAECYDTEGRFVPQKMEELFSKYDKGNKGHLTFEELLAATETNRNVMDVFGWIAAKVEWGALWLLCNKDGKLSRESVRSCYDGSLFYRREQEEEERQRARRQRIYQ